MPLTPQQLDRLYADAQKRIGRSPGSPYPFTFVHIPPNSSMHARFYTDCDGEFQQVLLRHKSASSSLSVLCTGPECAICRHADAMQGWPDLWRFRAREVTLTYACIHEYWGPRRRHVPIREPVLLVGDRRLADCLCGHIAELDSGDTIQSFFDVRRPHYAIKIASGAIWRDFTFVRATGPKRICPALPISYPPLSEVLYKPDDVPSPGLVARFIRAMDRAYQRQIHGKDSGAGNRRDDQQDLPWNKD